MRKLIEAPSGLKRLHVNRLAKQLHRDSGRAVAFKHCKAAVLQDHFRLVVPIVPTESQTIAEANIQRVSELVPQE